MILIFTSFEKLLNMGMKSDNLIKKDCLKLLNLQQSIKKCSTSSTESLV